MNYIKHLTGAFTRFADDGRLTPYHISLYLGLFQLWNLHRFVNPLSISRGEVMRLSKIGSVNTYSRCLRQLHEWGYIIYRPSYNPHRGSQVTFINFDKGTDTGSRQLSEKVVRPYINYINNGNNNKLTNEASEQPVSDVIKVKDKSGAAPDNNPKKKKVEPAGRNPDRPVGERQEKKFQPPAIDEALQFFREQNYPELEARKFYNYFKSVGWKVGKSKPMKDWHAAAHNWMLNAGTMSQKGHQDNNRLQTKNDKNYDEPL